MLGGAGAGAGEVRTFEIREGKWCCYIIVVLYLDMFDVLVCCCRHILYLLSGVFDFVKQLSC